MSHVGRIVIVCGYGCHLVPELTHYLDRVVQFVNEQEPALIIFCGGYTQKKTAPGTSEAALMYIYVRDRTHQVRACIVEEDSYTTYDNIQRAARKIQKVLPMRPQLIYADITIFCEATRALKVALLARHFLGFPPERNRTPIRIETDSWELMHPTLELIGTFKDWLAIKFPVINSWQCRQRIKKSASR